MNDSTKKKVLPRLRRIGGQLEGIARMVEADRYCVDVLLQVASAQAALNQVTKLQTPNPPRRASRPGGGPWTSL